LLNKPIAYVFKTPNEKTPMRKSSRVQSGGAAMVEFVVAALFFLVPMYLALAALGKFSDVQSVAHGIARYNVWEKTVWASENASAFARINDPNQKTETAIINEAAVRLLNDRRAGMVYRSSDASATTFANGTDPFWKDASGDEFITDRADIAATNSNGNLSRDYTGTALSALGSFSIPGVAGPFVPPTPNDTLASATVNLPRIAANSPVYGRLWSIASGSPVDWTGIGFSSQSGILSNTWSANGSGSAKAMVKTSVLTHQGLGAAAEAAVKIGMFGFDPIASSQLDLQVMDTDVIPPDRLR
jgi:hypothetical protein